MKFAVIIPTRDRPKCFERCKEQLANQTLKPSKVYAISYPSESDEMDLVERVKIGVDVAHADGIDLVFIIEDDDAYPKDYFARFEPFFDKYEFFGDEYTTYYNIRNTTYRTWHHPSRSSLFTTGFKISALDLFNWPANNEKFLDIKLWEYARRKKKIFIKTGAVGIKGHGEGKTGGKGHIMKLTIHDKDLSFLKSKVNGSFEFYQQLMKTL
jgi:hypothetical protein